MGEPGTDKTAWAAHVVQKWRTLHHFNVAAIGITRPEQCLENLCAQLIARARLDQHYLPASTGRDGDYLNQLLRQASQQLAGDKLIIVIDALDEVRMPAGETGVNTLYLPAALPGGVYIVLTRQPKAVALTCASNTPLETVMYTF